MSVVLFILFVVACWVLGTPSGEPMRMFAGYLLLFLIGCVIGLIVSMLVPFPAGLFVSAIAGGLFGYFAGPAILEHFDN